MAVIGTNNTSAPAPAFVPTVPERNTEVNVADWEATGILLPITAPVPVLIIFAESEARYRELLLKTVICPSEEVTFAPRGLEGDGLEVERVAEALDRLAA